MSSRAADRIKQRLRQHGEDVPDDVELHRSYAGYWGRKQGAWSWSLWSPSRGVVPFGSHYPATDLLRCRRWSIVEPNRISPDRSIDPCLDCQQADRIGCSPTTQARR